jgi:hypothetical protein
MNACHGVAGAHLVDGVEFPEAIGPQQLTVHAAGQHCAGKACHGHLGGDY